MKTWVVVDNLSNPTERKGIPYPDRLFRGTPRPALTGRAPCIPTRMPTGHNVVSIQERKINQQNRRLLHRSFRQIEQPTLFKLQRLAASLAKKPLSRSLHSPSQLQPETPALSCDRETALDNDKGTGARPGGAAIRFHQSKQLINLPSLLSDITEFQNSRGPSSLQGLARFGDIPICLRGRTPTVNRAGSAQKCVASQMYILLLNIVSATE